MLNTAKDLAVRAMDEVGNLLLRPPLGGLGQVVLHGPRMAKRAALTYDDGPNAPSTNQILDVLGECGVKATFFCVGGNALRHSAIVKRAFAEGHAIGSHSMFHSRKTGLMLHEQAHIDDCAAALASILGVAPRLYRAPWGWLTPWETSRLRSRGMSIIGWDVYTYDWRTPPPDGAAIAAAIASSTRPGSIILLHDGRPNVDYADRPQTVTATSETIRLLRARDYDFVTVPDLLGISAYSSTSELGAPCPSQTS